MTHKEIEKLKQSLKPNPKAAEALKLIAATKQQGEKLKTAIKAAETDLKSVPD
jgi:hypothetical protein